MKVKSFFKIQLTEKKQVIVVSFHSGAVIVTIRTGFGIRKSLMRQFYLFLSLFDFDHQLLIVGDLEKTELQGDRVLDKFRLNPNPGIRNPGKACLRKLSPVVPSPRPVFLNRWAAELNLVGSQTFIILSKSIITQMNFIKCNKSQHISYKSIKKETTK